MASLTMNRSDPAFPESDVTTAGVEFVYPATYIGITDAFRVRLADELGTEQAGSATTSATVDRMARAWRDSYVRIGEWDKHLVLLGPMWVPEKRRDSEWRSTRVRVISVSPSEFGTYQDSDPEILM